MHEITCQRCDKYFDAEPWDDGACPHCGAEFWWDSVGEMWSDDEQALATFRDTEPPITDHEIGGGQDGEIELED